MEQTGRWWNRWEQTSHALHSLIPPIVVFGDCPLYTSFISHIRWENPHHLHIHSFFVVTFPIHLSDHTFCYFSFPLEWVETFLVLPVIYSFVGGVFVVGGWRWRSLHSSCILFRKNLCICTHFVIPLFVVTSSDRYKSLDSGAILGDGRPVTTPILPQPSHIIYPSLWPTFPLIVCIYCYNLVWPCIYLPLALPTTHMPPSLWLVVFDRFPLYLWRLR